MVITYYIGGEPHYLLPNGKSITAKQYEAINENPTFIALKHALKIHELKNNILEIARCEKRDINTFTARELVSAADNLLDIMQDFDNDAYTRGQRKRLQNFVAKWRSEAGNI